MLELPRGEPITLQLCFWPAAGSSPQIYLLRRAGRPLVSQTAPLHPGSVRGKTHLVSPRLSHPSAPKTSWWWLSSPALPHKRKQLKWEQQHYLGTTEQCWFLFSPWLQTNSTHFYFCILVEAEVKQGPFPMAFGACPTLWSTWTFAVCSLTKAVACKCQFYGYTVETASASLILLDLFYSCREKADWQTSKPNFCRDQGKSQSFPVSHVKVLNQRRYHTATKNYKNISGLNSATAARAAACDSETGLNAKWHLSSFRD